MTKPLRAVAGVIVLVLVLAAPAWAFDADQTFKRGTFVLSGEGSYGWQFDLEDKRSVTYLEFYDVGVRFSLLPFDPFGRGHFWHGALEVGFEPLYQKYTEPKPAFWAGLTSVLRYHFLAPGRVVPYFELGAAGREEMVAQDGGQPRPEGRLGLRVLLIEGLEPDFERAVPEVAAAERIEGQQAEADADVVELEIGDAALVLEVELPAVAALAGEDEGAPFEGLVRIEGPGGRGQDEH